MNSEAKSSLHDIISNISSFGGLEINKELKEFTFKIISPKDCIYSAGDIICDVSFVVEGIGRYSYIDMEGNEKNKTLVRKGGVFASANSIVAGKPSPFSAQAITQCTIATISYGRLVEMGEKCHSWNVFLRKLLEHILLRMEKRKIDLLVLSPKQRYMDFLREFGADADQIPLRQVAMYLGITDVSLSRIRKELGLT